MGQTSAGRSRDLALWVWMAFVVLASLGLSRAFACATPFVAVAVLAAWTLPSRHAVAQMLLVWAGNQAIGFGLLHYPHTAAAAGWGVAIGVAALASLGAATMTRWSTTGRLRRMALAFLVAIVVYEAVLLAAAGVLPSGSGAFALLVVLRIAGINAVALGLLLAARELAAVTRWAAATAGALRG